MLSPRMVLARLSPVLRKTRTRKVKSVQHLLQAIKPVTIRYRRVKKNRTTIPAACCYDLKRYPWNTLDTWNMEVALNWR